MMHTTIEVYKFCSIFNMNNKLIITFLMALRFLLKHTNNYIFIKKKKKLPMKLYGTSSMFVFQFDEVFDETLIFYC